MIAGVYVIRNKVNGRRYVGSSMNIPARWKMHSKHLSEGRHHNKFLQRCWNKRCADSFAFETILYCAPDMCLFYEQRAMDCLRPEYNAAPVAGSQLGYKHTEETRKKMSAARRKDFSPFSGKRHTEETRRKISETKTGVKLGKYSPERIKKTADGMRKSIGALNESQVLDIRRLKAKGIKHADVAKQIGCSYWAVADIARNRTFKWVS